jgi:uncharacterized protein (TIGR03066 family)
MSAFRLLAAGLTLLVPLVSAGADVKKEKPDFAKLIVGKWEVTKADRELPVGSVVEFGKDGSAKFTVKDGEKQVTHEATYKVEDDKLLLTLKPNDEKKPPITIKKLSEKELVLQGDKDVFEFKRVK